MGEHICARRAARTGIYVAPGWCAGSRFSFSRIFRISILLQMPREASKSALWACGAAEGVGSERGA